MTLECLKSQFYNQTYENNIVSNYQCLGNTFLFTSFEEEETKLTILNKVKNYLHNNHSKNTKHRKENETLFVFVCK